MCTQHKDEPVHNGEEAGIEKDEDMFDFRPPPVFIELLLRIIEESSDNIVSWSTAGDSFIVKQASEEMWAVGDAPPPNALPLLVHGCALLVPGSSGRKEEYGLGSSISFLRNS